jgi:hypothetical protein
VVHFDLVFGELFDGLVWGEYLAVRVLAECCLYRAQRQAIHDIIIFFEHFVGLELQQGSLCRLGGGYQNIIHKRLPHAKGFVNATLVHLEHSTHHAYVFPH